MKKVTKDPKECPYKVEPSKEVEEVCEKVNKWENLNE